MSDETAGDEPNKAEKRVPALPRRSKVMVLPPKHLSKSEWVKRISSAWKDAQGEMLSGILQVGRYLIEAKEGPNKLPHGEFIAMIESELPFHKRTAQKLMKIANDKRLSKAAHVPLLPPSWGTLYQLTRLDEPTFDRLLDDGTIRPDRNEISKILRIGKVKADEKRILDLRPVAGKFRTIVVDPPWDYEWLSLAGRAAPGYATMSHEELLAMAGQFVKWSEDNCHLYLWTTNNFMTRAVELMAAWGFQHKTVLTWVKPKWGLGSYFRNQSEHVLFGVRGELRTRSDSIATIFEAPLGEHSEKPERFYEIVRAASYPSGRYFGEVFQRQARPDFKNLFEHRSHLVASLPQAAAVITPLPAGRVKWIAIESLEAAIDELPLDDDGVPVMPAWWDDSEDEWLELVEFKGCPPGASTLPDSPPSAT